MLKNYFLIAIRNLLKHKVFSFINILGLSIGISCCVLLALFIKEELSFDRHFTDVQNIYRVTGSLTADQGRNEKFPRNSPAVVMGLLHELPEIETATRVVDPPEVEQHLIRYEDKNFYETKGYLVDSTFFDVFDYAFQEGNKNTALDTRSSVVLSSTLAAKIFDDQSPLDKLLIINSGESTDTFRVTGVLKPLTKKSHVDADLYMSMNSNGMGSFVMNEGSWVINNFVYSYIKVKPGISLEGLRAKLPALMEKYGAEQMKAFGIQKTLDLQPLTDVHLYSASQFASEKFGYADLGGTGGNIQYIYILSSIGIFILLLACINFMNLTTAKASQRAGEVGVRKSLGANRANLISQFLGESMTIVVMAMILSLGIVQLVLPAFNLYTQQTLSIDTDNLIYITSALLGIALLTGAVAGSYPAFFLSSFQPAVVLKDKRLSGGSSNWLRKSLVVFQFVVTISLISSILIINQQMNYVHDKSLGFDPEYKLMIPLRTAEAKQAYERIKNSYEQLAGVEVAGATALPSMATSRDIPLYPQGSNMAKAQIHFNVSIDEGYFELLDIPLLAGRTLTVEKDTFNFDNALNHILVNRASLEASNISLENAVGSQLFVDFQGRHLTFQIEGVVEDFHQASLHQKVAPMIFLLPKERTSFVALGASVKAGNYQETLGELQSRWKELAPNTPFEYTLLSDEVKKQYEADQRVMALITGFTLIAIIISCLGLYGLSIFVAERKVKEIGIRKVMGASVANIVRLLSRDFVKLVMIAFVLSVPIGYYAMEKWLENFAYRIELNVWIFVMAGIVSFLIAWITIGFESVKAALSNPVNSLRNE